MKTLGERLKFARVSAGISQEKLAKILGISQGTIGHIENGVTKHTKYIVDLAQAVGVKPDWLATGVGEPRDDAATAIRTRTVKLVRISNLSRNGESLATSVVSPFLSIPEKDDFCLQVEGDSMESERGMPSFPDGSFILVRASAPPAPGKFVVAELGKSGKHIFRQLSSDGIDYYLKPLNRSYPVVKIDNLDCIVGTGIEWWAGGSI